MKRKKMEISIRTKQLKAIFSYDKKIELEDRPLEIRPYHFTQHVGIKEIEQFQRLFPVTGFCSIPDNSIQENNSFPYTIFTPKRAQKLDQAILLLHGLNERNWDKYLTWAEYLSLATGKAVILFPIAFHMNRTPNNWYNPRTLMFWVAKRKQEVEHLNNSTFVNVALSYRLSDTPLRFYISGKESLFNLWQLFTEIKSGQHPLFKKTTTINIFAYSIGAFLAQILMIANPDHLLNGSKLFVFCGGSIFNQMNGSARDIMDHEAFQRVKNYFLNNFLTRNEHHKFLPVVYREDSLEKAFKAMMHPDIMQEFREKFFEEAQDRIRIVTLKKDTVMPTIGAVEALGSRNANTILEELDFPYKYSHQNPFPTNTRVCPELLHSSFENLFNRAAHFL